jgi:hypothetical protein
MRWDQSSGYSEDWERCVDVALQPTVAHGWVHVVCACGACMWLCIDLCTWYVYVACVCGCACIGNVRMLWCVHVVVHVCVHVVVHA